MSEAAVGAFGVFVSGFCVGTAFVMTAVNVSKGRGVWWPVLHTVGMAVLTGVVGVGMLW